jgi:hypothetical protein
MNEALRKVSNLEIEEARGQQMKLSLQLEGLRAVRAEKIKSAAMVLGIPPQEFTIRALIARLPGQLGGQLDLVRERTRQLACKVDDLNRRNSTLAGHCLAFVRERLVGLTGENTIGRYSASGRTVDAPHNSFIQVQG